LIRQTLISPFILAAIIGEAGLALSRTRAKLAPEVLRILDRVKPLAKLAAEK
jgi:hypothetical protein